VTGTSGTGRAQRRRCLPCAPPGGQRGEARRRNCLSALPSRRGAGTWPGSPAGSRGRPAAAPSQLLHGPVRGRLCRQVYRCDRLCTSHRCPPQHSVRGWQYRAAAWADRGDRHRAGAGSHSSVLSTIVGENCAHQQAHCYCQWGVGILSTGGACGGQRWGKTCDTGTTRARPAVPCRCPVSAGG
jgi:hypothetical protein